MGLRPPVRTHHHLGGEERPLGASLGMLTSWTTKRGSRWPGSSLLKVQLLGSAEWEELSWEGRLEKSSCRRAALWEGVHRAWPGLGGEESLSEPSQSH